MAGALTPTGAVTNDARVLITPSPLRAAISAVLLLVQVLGLGHLAFAEHALGAGGAVVEAAPLAADAHDEAGDHLCAAETQVSSDGPEDCVVLAGWSTPSLVAPVAQGVALRHAAQPDVRSAAQVEVQLEVLARAPKGSPPRG